MAKPTIASLTAHIATLEARITALETAAAEKSAPAPRAAVKSAAPHTTDESITIDDLAAAIRDSSAFMHLSHSSLAFSVRGSRWRVRDLTGMTPVAMAGRIRAHVLAGRPLQAAKWERVR